MREVVLRVTCDWCGAKSEEDEGTPPPITLTAGSDVYEGDPCPVCLQTLISKMRKVKKTGEFACAKCGKTYAREKSRDKHQEGCTK